MPPHASLLRNLHHCENGRDLKPQLLSLCDLTVAGARAPLYQHQGGI